MFFAWITLLFPHKQFPFKTLLRMGLFAYFSDELTAREACRSDCYLLFGAVGAHRAAFLMSSSQQSIFLVNLRYRLLNSRPDLLLLSIF